MEGRLGHTSKQGVPKNCQSRPAMVGPIRSIVDFIPARPKGHFPNDWYIHFEQLFLAEFPVT